MIDISVNLPYRSSGDYFDNMLKSFVRNTKDLDSVEINAVIDDDDYGIVDRQSWYNERYPFLRFWQVKRSEHFIRDYHNYAAKVSRGRYIMAVCADVLFLTPGWDRLVYDGMVKACEQDGDDVHLGLINDCHPERIKENAFYPNFSMFPVVSREAVEYLGYMYDERCWVWGVDHIIADVYRELGRLVSLTHVRIDHDSPHNSKRPVDDTYLRIAAIDRQHPFQMTPEDVKTEVEKLKTFINARKNNG